MTRPIELDVTSRIWQRIEYRLCAKFRGGDPWLLLDGHATSSVAVQIAEGVEDALVRARILF